MRLPSLLALASSLPAATALIGHGVEMYNPTCAFACRAAIASVKLTCSGHEDHGVGMSHGATTTTSPECRAGDTAFLTTLAWCMDTMCAPFSIETWRLEKYWEEKTTGLLGVVPKWTYAKTLQEIAVPPKAEFDKKGVLNDTVVVPHMSWHAQMNTLGNFEAMETNHSKYAIVLLVVGFATPIVFTLLGHLPFMTSLFDKMKPYLVYPTIIGKYHIQPLPYLLGNAPTIGHSLYIFFFLVLNVVFACVGYTSKQPNLWFSSTYLEILAFSAARTGVLAFALAPLVILFSSRNNILLWLTNCSHATYLLLHRWVARIFALQTILHSILELILYVKQGTFAEETVLEYWIWGIVATLAVCIMLVISPLYMRRRSYEWFLVLHVVLAVFVLVGCWYHVELLFYRKWGYEMWIYAACAVWFADRLIRVLRIAKVGIRRAKVVEVGGGIVRVDVEGVRWSTTPGRHAYAYFPTLSPLRPWQNHPFSIIPTALLQPRTPSLGSASPSSSSTASQDVEKGGVAMAVTDTVQRRSATGVTLYIRKSNGVTKLLQNDDTLVTLLDGPYPNNCTAAVLKCDRLLLIGGGIGITALLSFVGVHANTKVFWSVKNSAECMVRELEPVLERVHEREVRVGKRLDVEKLLAEEALMGWKKIGVVVCGPGGLCDDIRAAVVREGRAGPAVFELEVDAFTW